MKYENKEILTAKEFAHYMGVHYNTVRNMIRKGKLNAFKIGCEGLTSDFRIPKSELQRLAAFNLDQVVEDLINKRIDEKKSKDINRFLKNVEKTPTCWLWIGAITKSGYGVFSIDKKYIRAHRGAYLLYKGEIPKNMFVLHCCDVRNCVNPLHLRLGTPQDNMDDRKKRNRFIAKKGESCKVSKLTNAEVKKIRELRDQKIPCKEIAKIFNISHKYVSELYTKKYRV